MYSKIKPILLQGCHSKWPPRTSLLQQGPGEFIEIFKSNVPDVLVDITVKGKDPVGKIFAPAWKMVAEYLVKLGSDYMGERPE